VPVSAPFINKTYRFLRDLHWPCTAHRPIIALIDEGIRVRIGR